MLILYSKFMNVFLSCYSNNGEANHLVNYLIVYHAYQEIASKRDLFIDSIWIVNFISSMCTSLIFSFFIFFHPYKTLIMHGFWLCFHACVFLHLLWHQKCSRSHRFWFQISAYHQSLIIWKLVLLYNYIINYSLNDKI